jgi:hypothetical protein
VLHQTGPADRLSKLSRSSTLSLAIAATASDATHAALLMHSTVEKNVTRMQRAYKLHFAGRCGGVEGDYVRPLRSNLSMRSMAAITP